MAPPGTRSKKPSVMIAVGVKPKQGPPGMGDEGIDHPEGHDQDEESGGKATAEKALVVRSDHHCKDCSNYDASSGDCSKVEGIYDPEDACLRYFTHSDSSDEEPDADEQGGPPDNDADDSGDLGMGPNR